MTATITETQHSLNCSVQSAISLRELLEDGFYLLCLLRDGNPPTEGAEFNRRVDAFLEQFERNAKNFGKSAESIGQTKYAFCALLDESILSSAFDLRDDWERMPLQLRLFGEHLAGEGFFERLEVLRLEPTRNIEALEVFHTCLLLGFQGKYLLGGTEKLAHLTERVGREIQHERGGPADFAPNWKLPQQFQGFVRNELPLWLYFALLALIGSIIFAGYRFFLGNQIDRFLGI